MLLSEFVERTGVTPSAEEYARIEEEYYDFPGDKDAFCRAWVKSHPASVRKAKERKAWNAKMAKVFTILCRLDRWNGTQGAFTTQAQKGLNKSDEAALEAVSFDLCRVRNDRWYTIGDLRYDLSQFFKHSTERV